MPYSKSLSSYSTVTLYVLAFPSFASHNLLSHEFLPKKKIKKSKNHILIGRFPNRHAPLPKPPRFPPPQSLLPRHLCRLSPSQPPFSASSHPTTIKPPRLLIGHRSHAAEAVDGLGSIPNVFDSEAARAARSVDPAADGGVRPASVWAGRGGGGRLFDRSIDQGTQAGGGGGHVVG